MSAPGPDTLGTSRAPRRRERHGDFTLTPRVLWVCLWAMPIGASARARPGHCCG